MRDLSHVCVGSSALFGDLAWDIFFSIMTLLRLGLNPAAQRVAIKAEQGEIMFSYSNCGNSLASSRGLKTIKRFKSLGLTLLSAAAVQATAAPTVIDFDSLSAPVVLTSEFSGLGVLFSGNNLVSNSTFGGQVVVPSGSNYVRFGTGFTISFVDVSNSAVDATTNFVSFANLGIHSGGVFNGLTVSARDVFGGELATAVVAPVGPGVDISPFTTSISVSGIHSLVFTNIPNTGPSGGGIVGFDTFTFNAASVSPVPEPESYALVLAGLAMVAGVVRRKAKVQNRPTLS